MSTTITPNMQLVIPVVGSEAGPQYAVDINNSLTIIDQHNHALGSGVQITPAGLNINTSLPMNGQLLSLPSAVNFQAQTTDPLPGSIYEKGVDLYYIDGSGNVIRITQSGSVAGSTGTITGLPSGTASAAYAAGTFVFQSATNVAASIDGASFILRNTTVSSFGLTLQPPSGLASNYTLTLPSIPAQTNVMVLDSSGNMGSITYDAVGQAMSVTGANAILASSNNANLGGSTVKENGRNLVVSNTNNINSLAICRGFVQSNGAPTAGEGFSASRTSAGRYTVTFDTAFLDTPIITISSGFGDAQLQVVQVSAASPPTTTTFSVTVIVPNTGTATDGSFYFIAIGQRT